MALTLTVPFKSLRAYAALVLGIGFGLVLYSYRLVDALPATSRAALLVGVLAAALGVAAYYLLLDRLVAPLLPAVERGDRWWLLAGSAAVGIYLAIMYLGGTGQATPRYITFLLPRQYLGVSVPPHSNVENAQIQILRFTTSLGDISYGSIHYHGWTRKGTDLILTDPANNRLEWTGRTGDSAILTFGSSARPALVQVTWNARTENIALGTEADGRYQAVHQFPVPFYATRMFLLFLGALDFIVLCLAANLLIWKNRAPILTGLERSFEALIHPAQHPAPGGGVAARGLSQGEWALIVGMTSLALALRVFNLGRLYPYNDEYAHLLAAKALLQGAPLGSVFDRSLFIVTVPVFLSIRLFGAELWAARLPGVIFSALAILPLFLLTRRINMPVAILSCVLYAASPWLIAISRNVREYAYYPFYCYWIAFAMVVYLERLPSGMHFFRDWKTLFGSGRWLLVVILLFVPFYAVFLDARSTAKLIFIAYGIAALFLLFKFDLHHWPNLALFAMLGVAVLLAGFAYARAFGHAGLSVSPQYRPQALQFFFPDPVQQWYSDRPVVVPLVILASAVVLCVRSLRANFIPSFVGALALAYAFFFMVFFGYLLLPRYQTLLQLWYVVVFALGVFGLFVFLMHRPGRDVALPLTATVLLALAFNVSQVVVPSTYDKQGTNPITADYHFNMGPAYSYLQDKVSSQDALLSSQFAGYVHWKGAPQFKQIYPYGFYTYGIKYKGIFPYETAEPIGKTPGELIASAVGQNDTGWIVLDSISYFASNDRPLPLKATTVDGKQVDYVGYFGGEYIWRWHPVQPAP